MSQQQTDAFNAAESLSRMDGRPDDDRWFTPASVGISLVIVAVFAYFLPFVYLRYNLRVFSGGYLPVVAVFPFLLLLVLNGIVRTVGVWLRRGEVTVIFCAMMVSLSTLMMTALLFTALPSPVQGASPTNKFEELFMWGVDSRLIPYTMQDKELEASAGQFDESLNWYYMGIPRPLSSGGKDKSKAAGASAAAGSATESTSAADTGYDPSKLRVPWWRWVRRHGVDRGARLQAYGTLAGRIRETKGLGPDSEARMLREVEVLKAHVEAIEVPLILSYRENAQQETYAKILRRLHESRKVKGAEAAALAALVAAERKADLETPPWRWTPELAVQRVAAYAELVRKVKATPGLESWIIEDVEPLIGALAQRSGPQQEIYGLLLEKVAAAKGVSDADRTVLADAVRAEQEKDLALPWWEWTPALARGRSAAYEDLAARVAATNGLDAAARTELPAQVRRLETNVDTVTSGAAAYARLLRLVDDARGVKPADRQALARAIRAETGADRQIALYFEIPPERRAVDLPFYGWTGPLVWWLILLTFFVVLQFCLAAILRRQWIDHEKLLFPHVEILEAVTEPGSRGWPGGSIIRSRLMWVGFGFAIVLYGIDGMRAYFSIDSFYDLNNLSLAPLLKTPPWSAIPKDLNIHLFVLAIAFVLPSEISLSLWAFVLLDFATRVYAESIGLTYHQFEPFLGYQINEGADQQAGFIVFVIALIIIGRRHFRNVIRKAFGLAPEVDDSTEPLSYVTAFWGAVFCSIGILVWCFVMGMSIFLSFLLFGITLFGIIFLARVVSELGILTGTYQEPSMPQYLVVGSFGYHGVQHIGQWTLWDRMIFMTPTFATWTFLWPAFFYCPHVLPLTMTSERMVRDVRSRRRFTLFLLFLTLAVMGVFAVRSISVPYTEEGGGIKLKQGRQNSFGHSFDNCLARDFIEKESMYKPFPWTYVDAIVGAVVMIALLTLRHLFYWWPLHPIGYICPGLDGGIWFSVFIGWFVKRAVLKYGGGNLFRKVIPLFVGMLIGHVVVAGIWMLVAVLVQMNQGEAIYSAIWFQP